MAFCSVDSVICGAQQNRHLFVMLWGLPKITGSGLWYLVSSWAPIQLLTGSVRFGALTKLK